MEIDKQLLNSGPVIKPFIFPKRAGPKVTVDKDGHRDLTDTLGISLELDIWLLHCQLARTSGKGVDFILPHAVQDTTNGHAQSIHVVVQFETEVQTDVVLWQFAYCVSVWRDMEVKYKTEVQVELDKKREKLQLERMIHEAPFGLFKTHRKSGFCEYVNPAYTEVTGLTLEQAQGCGWKKMFEPDVTDMVVKEWSMTRTPHTPSYSGTLPITWPNGERRYMHCFWTGSGQYEKDDEDDVSLGMLIDVTDEVMVRKKLEQQTTELSHAVEKAELATKFKSEFLAVVSHEIRTPLNGMLGMASLIRETKLNADQEHMLFVITDCGKSLFELVNDVLEFSKIEAGSIELTEQVFDLGDLLRSAVNIFSVAASEKGLTLNCSIEPSAPTLIVGDSLKLRRVIMNLVGNSVKFTEQGSIDVSCSLDPGSLVASKPSLRFQIKDTGVGISENAMGSLFQPFRQADSSITRKYGGTGLGLTISKQLVELMGGSISVRSLVNVGTTFEFNILAVFGCPKSIKQTSPVKPSSVITSDEIGKPLRILLVEDNKINQQLALRMLKKLHLTADVANDGFECVDAVNTKVYDLIFMDMSMPGRSGLEATAIIRKHPPKEYTKPPLIVAMTANALDSDRRMCFEVGMNEFIAKPFNITDFKRAVVLAVSYHSS